VLIKKLIPKPLVNRLKQHLAFRKLSGAVDRIRKGDTSLPVLNALLEGWNNSGFASRPEYLSRIAELARERESFLECGSGASTILLAAMGVKVTSLEHVPAWHSHVNKSIAKLNLKADLRLTRLRNYGEFDWYDVPDLQPGYSAVICDGPPDTTLGGRYGLLPVARTALQTDCVILLDDTIRAGERQIAARWCSEFGLSFTLCGTFGELHFSNRNPTEHHSLPL
jgi:Methyltransferase domain